jgi:transposase
LPVHLKTQIRRELDRLELLLDQIKEAEAERDALLAAPQPAAPAPAGRMLLEFKGIGAELAAVLWYFATLTIAASSAFTCVAARTLAPSPIRDLLHRRLQPFRHLHDCSGCFRLERSPGGLAPTGKRRLLTAHAISGH